MKKTFTILFFMLVGVYVYGQSTYKRMYNAYNGWESYNQLIGFNPLTENTIVLGYSIDLTGSDSASLGIPYLIKLNKAGEAGIPKHYFKKGFYSVGGGDNGRFLNDGSYLLNMSVRDSSGKYEQRLFIVDTATLDTIRTISVALPSSKHLTRQVMFRNNLEYRHGSLEFTSNSDFCPFFLVTDTNGTNKAYKTYSSNKGYIFNTLFTSENTIFFGGIYRYDINDIRIATWYGVMDTLGNILWEKRIEDSTISKNARGVFATVVNNRYYLYGGDQYSSSPFLSLAEVNIKTGEILWKKKIIGLKDLEAISIFEKKSHDNALYITGDYKTGQGTLEENQFGMLAKFDENGNVKWKRLFQEAKFENRLWSLNFIENGMLLLGDAREIDNDEKSNAWIIKTDTFGCVVPGCQLKDGVPQIIGKGISFMLYPNPSTTQVSIKYNQDKNGHCNNLRIQDLNGKLVHGEKLNSTTNEVVISTLNWLNGTYFMEVLSDIKIIGCVKFQVIR